MSARTLPLPLVLTLCVSLLAVAEAGAPRRIARKCDPIEIWDQLFAAGDDNQNNATTPEPRQLQDLQVAIEVRFIAVDDQFFERIGVDFDVKVRPRDLQCNPNDVDPNINFPPTDLPNMQVNPFRQPLFLDPPAHAGTVFGYAVLSDIEAFFFLQAVQGDQRSNVLVAPMVTLFNGQVANVASPDTRNFLTDMVVEPGIGITLKPCISADEQFIKLSLLPFFHGLGPSPFDAPPDGEVDDTPGDPDAPVQQPFIKPVSVSTTVSVPDGGTILLGGIQRIEAQGDARVRSLMRIPYLNRLFRNTGIGRDTQPLLLMVTPRIVIQEEEE